MSDFDSDTGDISLSLPSSSFSNFPQARAHDIPSPTPQRLLGKSLRSNSISHLQSVAFDDNEVSLTPHAGPSHRPCSAALRPEADSTPTPLYRRTSSSGSLTRSRSLSVRIPTVDLSSSPPSRGPASATSRTPSMRLGWTRRPGEPRPPPLVTEEVGKKMGRWVKEVVVCNFDLERGPVVERRAMGRRWGPGEKDNV